VCLVCFTGFSIVCVRLSLSLWCSCVTGRPPCDCDAGCDQAVVSCNNEQLPHGPPDLLLFLLRLEHLRYLWCVLCVLVGMGCLTWRGLWKGLWDLYGCLRAGCVPRRSPGAHCGRLVMAGFVWGRDDWFCVGPVGGRDIWFCGASGITVAGGVFIPSLLTGAAMGRILGQLLNSGPLDGHVVDAGVYAFVGG
jgi:hypothetical protein